MRHLRLGFEAGTNDMINVHRIRLNVTASKHWHVKEKWKWRERKYKDCQVSTDSQGFTSARWQKELLTKYQGQGLLLRAPRCSTQESCR
jgi:hypothetical protein